MMYTFKDACEYIADTVKNGLSPTHGDVKKRVNICQRNLMMRLETQYKRMFIELSSYNGHICCPSNVERIVKHTISNCPRTVYSEFYQFLPYGPGSRERLENGKHGDLVDLGAHYATFFDPHAPVQLMAFSDSSLDEGATLKVKGVPGTTYLPNIAIFDNTGMEEEEIKIQHRIGGIDSMYFDPAMASTTTYARIDRVIKSQTKGNIVLLGYLPSDSGVTAWVYGKYGKSEKVPNYRRYRIAGAAAGEEADIFALVQLTHVDLFNDDDILGIQNLAAIEAESRSIETFKVDAGRGIHFQNLAAKMLREQTKNSYVESTEITFDVDDCVGARGL